MLKRRNTLIADGVREQLLEMQLQRGFDFLDFGDDHFDFALAVGGP